MKRYLAMSGLAVWTLGLLIGLGFAVAAQVNATESLPLENLQLMAVNQALVVERDSLQEQIELERVQYLVAIGLQNNMLLRGTTAAKVTTLGPWPREE